MSVGAWTVSLWAGVAASFSALTLLRLREASALRRPLPSVPVVLLRPLDAPTEQELRNLAVPVAWPGGLIHGVVSSVRPALPEGVQWVHSEPTLPNRKVGHLIQGWRTWGTEEALLLAVDADVVVTSALLQGLVQPLVDGAALSFAAPWPEGAKGWWARAAAALLRYTHHNFGALHAMRAGAPALCGKALGFSVQARSLLPEVGAYLGEDLELAQRLHQRGLQVALSREPARVPRPPVQPEPVEGWATALSLHRFTRWMQVLRAQRPWLYPTVPFLFTPTPLLLLLALLFPSALGTCALLTLCLFRTLLALRLESRAVSQGNRAFTRAASDWFLGELLLLTCFLRSTVMPSTVSWRGRRYTLLPGGRIQ